MCLTPILSATAAAETTVSDALPHLLGMLLVILTLAVLWGVCVLTATLIRTFTPAVAAPTPAPSTAPPSASLTTEDPRKPAPEIVAVIAAAVATVTGPSHRIVSIKPQSSSWEKAGRQSIISSHNIR